MQANSTNFTTWGRTQSTSECYCRRSTLNFLQNQHFFLSTLFQFETFKPWKAMLLSITLPMEPPSFDPQRKLTFLLIRKVQFSEAAALHFFLRKRPFSMCLLLLGADIDDNDSTINLLLFCKTSVSRPTKLQEYRLW